MKTNLKILLFVFLPILAINLHAQIPTNGLVSYYSFTGNANDGSGNNYNGVVQSATQTTGICSQSNSGYSFNGSSSYIDFPSSSSITFPQNKMSLSFWVKINGIPTIPNGLEMGVFEKINQNLGIDPTGASAQGFKCSFTPSNSTNGLTLVIKSGSSSNWGAATIPYSSFNMGSYNHICYSIDGTTIKAYINNSLITTSTIPNGTTIGNNSLSYQLGKSRWTSNSSPMAFFLGSADNLRVYNRDLTSAEVSALYNECSTSSNIYCFSTTDGVGTGTWNGWSYKDFIIPSGYKIDSVYGDFDRPGYPVSQYDYIFQYCANTTVWNQSLIQEPFNYGQINTSLYDYWISLTSFNYSDVGMVRVYLPTNAGAFWNSVCFAVSPACNIAIPTISPSGNTTICQGQSVTLTSSPANSYLWSNGQQTQSITVNPTQNTTYTVTVSNGNCSATSQALSINVNSLPTTPTITPSGSTTICQGQSVTLTSTPANSYLWSNGQQTQSIIVNQTGLYSLIVSNGLCSSSPQNIQVTVNPLPNVSIVGVNNTYCSNEGSVNLQGNPIGGVFTIDGVSTNTLTPSSLSIGLHNIVYNYTDVNGCNNSTQQQTSIIQAPVVSINNLNSSYLIGDTPVTLIGNPAGGIFFGNGVSGNVFSPSQAGVGLHTIIYTSVSPNGCYSSFGQCVEVTLTNNMEEEIYTPLKVYPNPTNNILNIVFDKYATNSVVEVFNIVGKLVYSQSNLSGQSIIIDTHSLASGTYLLRATFDGKIYNQLFVKE